MTTRLSTDHTRPSSLVMQLATQATFVGSDSNQRKRRSQRGESCESHNLHQCRHALRSQQCKLQSLNRGVRLKFNFFQICFHSTHTCRGDFSHSSNVCNVCVHACVGACTHAAYFHCQNSSLQQVSFPYVALSEGPEPSSQAPARTPTLSCP